MFIKSSHVGAGLAPATHLTGTTVVSAANKGRQHRRHLTVPMYFDRANHC